MFKFLFKSSKQDIVSQLKRANLLYEQKHFVAAAKLYRQILKADSRHFAARANLATACFEQGDFISSIPLFKEVIKVDSANPWWYNYLSQACQKTGDYKQALTAAWQAVCLGGNGNEHHLNLAYTIYETADAEGREFVDSVLQKWYRRYPKNGIAKQCYKSFYCDDNFVCSEPEYVENLFDVFAPDFDKVLAELGYDSPKNIAHCLGTFLKEKSDKKLKILDLGCGSGLCGKEIRKNIKECRLVGVDISANMLQEAKLKNVYDKLIKSNITDCFKIIKSKFDVVAASDVFTYFGRLNLLFSSIADSLKKGGVFVFTVSLNKQNDKDFFLMPSSRFVHSAEYVEKTLADSGFFIVKNEEKILRKEGEKDVVGRIFLSIKS